MPLSTPTFTLAANNTTGFIRLTITNPSTAPDTNQVWRSTSTENGGLPVEITGTLKTNGIYTDYNVASGKSYVYFIRAVLGSASLDSVTAQGTVTLARKGVFHAVTKNYGSTNKLPSIPVLPVFDLEPHTRSFGRALTEYQTTHQGIEPVVGISPIEETAAQFTARIRLQEKYDTRTLRAMHQSSSYLCYRDTLGNKIFGVLADYTEQYSDTYTDAIISFLQMDYDESVE